MAVAKVKKAGDDKNMSLKKVRGRGRNRSARVLFRAFAPSWAGLLSAGMR